VKLVALIAEAPSGGGGNGGGGDGAKKDAPPFAGMLNFVVLIAFMFLLLWLLAIRPQKKREQEHRRLLDALKPKDRVVTSGGIYGEIVSMKENEVILRVDQKKDVQMTVARRSIMGVRKRGDEGGEKQSQESRQ